MANLTPPSSPPTPPEADPLELAQTNLIAAQQAFVAAQQSRANAQNDSVLGGAVPATVNVTLDPDLSALFNDPSVQNNNAYKAVIAALQTVRLAQQAAGSLSSILTRLGAAPQPQPVPEPSVQVQPIAQPTTTTTNPQA